MLQKHRTASSSTSLSRHSQSRTLTRQAWASLHSAVGTTGRKRTDWKSRFMEMGISLNIEVGAERTPPSQLIVIVTGQTAIKRQCYEANRQTSSAIASTI